MLPSTAALAGARHFTFLYEAPTSAPGSIELENWITWERVTNPEQSDQIGFRHEIEIGVTDHFQASIYFADWFYERNRNQSGFNYSDSAIELIYNLTNPVIDPVGLSVYGEIKGGRQNFELESKLIAQKNFGPLILDYNLTGPNVAFRHQNWFVTVTALAQATNTADEADFKVRTIFGFGF